MTLCLSEPTLHAVSVRPTAGGENDDEWQPGSGTYEVFDEVKGGVACLVDLFENQQQSAAVAEASEHGNDGVKRLNPPLSTVDPDRPILRRVLVDDGRQPTGEVAEPTGLGRQDRPQRVGDDCERACGHLRQLTVEHNCVRCQCAFRQQIQCGRPTFVFDHQHAGRIVQSVAPRVPDRRRFGRHGGDR